MDKLLIVFLFLFLVMLIMPKIEKFMSIGELDNWNNIFERDLLRNTFNMTRLQMNRDSLDNIENRVESIVKDFL